MSNGLETAIKVFVNEIRKGLESPAVGGFGPQLVLGAELEERKRRALSLLEQVEALGLGGAPVEYQLFEALRADLASLGYYACNKTVSTIAHAIVANK